MHSHRQGHARAFCASNLLALRLPSLWAFGLNVGVCLPWAPRSQRLLVCHNLLGGGKHMVITIPPSYSSFLSCHTSIFPLPFPLSLRISLSLSPPLPLPLARCNCLFPSPYSLNPPPHVAPLQCGAGTQSTPPSTTSSRPITWLTTADRASTSRRRTPSLPSGR